MANSVDIFV